MSKYDDPIIVQLHQIRLQIERTYLLNLHRQRYLTPSQREEMEGLVATEHWSNLKRVSKVIDAYTNQ